MSKSTIEFPDKLPMRVTEAAELDAEAEARYAEILRTGETVSFHDMQAYLQRLVQDELAPLARGRAVPQ